MGSRVGDGVEGDAVEGDAETCSFCETIGLPSISELLRPKRANV